VRLTVLELNEVVKKFLIEHPYPKHQAEVKLKICDAQIEKILKFYDLKEKN
jgi:hypothetical protein